MHIFVFGELDARLIELFGRLCVTFTVFGSRPIGMFVPFCSKETDASGFVPINGDKS